MCGQPFIIIIIIIRMSGQPFIIILIIIRICIQPFIIIRMSGKPIIIIIIIIRMSGQPLIVIIILWPLFSSNNAVRFWCSVNLLLVKNIFIFMFQSLISIEWCKCEYLFIPYTSQARIKHLSLK